MSPVFLSKASTLDLLTPDWPAPANVQARITTRSGGVSQTPFDDLNLAAHVGDALSDVQCNRDRLQNALALSAPITWINQVHGTRIIEIDGSQPDNLDADATMSRSPGFVCSVLTADCLPVLMCDRQGTQVAAVHAGWQGLAQGILSKAVAAFDCSAGDVRCYLGPAISAAAFEVGVDVRDQFLKAEKKRAYASPVGTFFRACGPGKWMGDLYGLSRSELAGCGVRQVYGGQYCSFSQQDKFYSYRRDHCTGRMASLIWLTS